MSRIRKLYYFDKRKVKEMVYFLPNRANDNYINNIMFNPFTFFHYLLPLKFKYLPESYILKENNRICALITVAPIGHNKKIEIQKLFFEQNSYAMAEELVQYVVSKYKAMGATSVIIKVDNSMTDLLSLLVSKCGFSQISYEKLWKIKTLPAVTQYSFDFCLIKNSDLNAVSNLYNDLLLPHIRPLLGQEPADFRGSIFRGLSYYDEYKYVFKDISTKNIAGLLNIRTSDGENFIIDIIQSMCIDVDLAEIISFAVQEIRKRQRVFNLYVKTKRYTHLGEKYEKYCIDNKYQCVQNQIVLTNSSAKVLKTCSEANRYTVLSDICPSDAIPTRS